MSRRVSSPELVGRADALSALEAALDRAAAEEPGLAVLLGEAGVGKTRLARELARRSTGSLVLWGDCVSVGAGELPYGPVVAALRGLTQDLDEGQLERALGPGRRELVRLLPELGDAPADEATPASQTRLFELVLGLFHRLGQQAPVLLVIEDVHWADRSTWDLLDFVVRNLRRERLLLVATYRTDELAPGHQIARPMVELLRVERAEHIELERLSRAELALQLSGILGYEPDQAFTHRIYERSGGNPFFTEELLTAGDGDALPETLRATLLARVGDLSPAASRVRAIAAVAGREIGYDALDRIEGLDDRELTAALHELVDSGVFVCNVGTHDYDFRHALMREATYAELLPREREWLHRALATALAAATPDAKRSATQWAELAHHRQAAGDSQGALEASVAAGLAAERVYAFAEAQRQYERAESLWPRVPNAARAAGIDEAELLRRLAEVTGLAGDVDRAVAAAQRALTRLDPSRDSVRVAELHTRIGRWERRLDASLTALDQALDLLPDTPSLERATTLVSKAGALNAWCRPFDAREHASAALAMARQVGARSEEARAGMVLGCVRAYLGDPAGGVALLREAYRLSADLGTPEDLGGIANNFADALVMTGRIEEALEVYLEGHEEMCRVGLRAFHGAFLEIGAAECLLRLGRWDEADRWTVPLLAQLPADPDTEIYLRAVCALLDTRRGALEAATVHVARGVELLDANVSRDAILITSVARAEHALTSGPAVTARETVAEARTRLTPQPGGLLFYPPLLSLGLRAEAGIAERARSTGDPDGVLAAHEIAAELLEALLSCEFLEPRDAPAPPEVLAHHAAGRAEFARLEGTPDPELWEHAADQWTALGMPFEAAYANWRAAEGSLSAGRDRACAQRRLRAAHGAAAALGAAVLLGEIEALARRARIDAGGATTDRRAAEAPAGLTARELTVLQLMSAGRTNREIADELFLSRRTVDMHVRHILAKLNAANRVEAAGIAHRLGLVAPA